MPGLNYVIGDATRPRGDGLKFVLHCCNDVGGWGSGFVVAVSKRWPRPEIEYRRWYSESGAEGFKRQLGSVQLVPVERDIWVANLIGQVGLRRATDGQPPVRYDALAQGFAGIADYAGQHPERAISVHAPRLGCGLAGGNWEEVEPLLVEHLVERGVSVTIYDLP